MSFPTDLASNGSLLIAANNVASTLNGGINSGATSMTLASTANFPLKGGVTIETEAIIYTGNDTATAVLSGLTRGADSTTAAIHADGTAVYMNMQARHHNALKDEIIAIEQNISDRFGATTTGATIAGVVTHNGATIFNTTTTWNTTTSIKGTPTNNDAAAGYVGEYMEKSTATAANVPTSGQYGDTGVLSLTAGDWDVTQQMTHLQNGATWTGVFNGIGTATGNDNGGLVGSHTLLVAAWSSSSTTPEQHVSTVANVRISVAASTTIYGKVRAAYSAGTPQYTFRISARRMR